MEENQNQAPVEQPENASGNEGQDKQDQVAYESYQKLLKEKKGVQSRLSEYEQQLKELKEEKMQRDGQKDELLEEYKKRLSEREKELNNTRNTYAWNTLTGEIKREAMSHGCVNPEKLIRLMDDDDLKSIEVGEDFSINTESLKNVIEKSKKENHFLFKTSSAAVANGKPGKKAPDSQKSIKDMSVEELEQAYKKAYK